MALEREVSDRDLARGADLGEHLGHIGVDLVEAHRPRHRHPVVAVLDEMHLADPVHVDRGHLLALPLRGGHALPAWPHPARRGAKTAVDLAAAVHGPDDRVELDHLEAELALAASPERLHHLLEREDHVDVAAPQAGGEPGYRPPPPLPVEVELCDGLGEAGVARHRATWCTPSGADNA